MAGGERGRALGWRANRRIGNIAGRPGGPTSRPSPPAVSAGAEHAPPGYPRDRRQVTVAQLIEAASTPRALDRPGSSRAALADEPPQPQVLTEVVGQTVVGEPGPPTLPPRPPVLLRGRIVGVGGQFGRQRGALPARACSPHTRLHGCSPPQHRAVGPRRRRHTPKPNPRRTMASNAASSAHDHRRGDLEGVSPVS